MIINRGKAFSTSKEELPFNTSVIAKLRTINDNPVYFTPMGVADFVKKEISELLRNGIIRPSKSPFNNLSYAVDKKGHVENGKRNKCLVIDLRKLNERTVADKYPMPNIPMIFANLGKVPPSNRSTW